MYSENFAIWHTCINWIRIPVALYVQMIDALDKDGSLGAKMIIPLNKVGQIKYVIIDNIKFALSSN